MVSIGPNKHNITGPRAGFGWPGLIGVAISVLLLWWTLRDVSPAELWSHVSRVAPLPMLGAVAAATATFPLRTIRWQLLLRFEGRPLPFSGLWHATAIGFMASNILPARAGEIARPYAAHKITSVRFTTAAGSVAVERVLDSIVLLAMLSAAATLGGFAVDEEIAGFALGDVLFAGAVLALTALTVATLAVLRPSVTLSLARRLLGFALPNRWTEKIIPLLEGVFDGLSVLRDPRRLSRALVWSIVIWGVNGFSFLLAIWAFRLTVPASAAFVLQGMIGMAVAIPSSPGFFGPFEAATRITLSAYGISGAEAAAYAGAYHLTTFVPITLLGLWSLSRADLRIGDLGRSRSRTSALEHTQDGDGSESRAADRERAP